MSVETNASNETAIELAVKDTAEQKAIQQRNPNDGRAVKIAQRPDTVASHTGSHTLTDSRELQNKTITAHASAITPSRKGSVNASSTRNVTSRLVSQPTATAESENENHSETEASGNEYDTATEDDNSLTIDPREIVSAGPSPDKASTDKIDNEARANRVLESTPQNDLPWITPGKRKPSEKSPDTTPDLPSKKVPKPHRRSKRSKR